MFLDSHIQCEFGLQAMGVLAMLQILSFFSPAIHSELSKQVIFLATCWGMLGDGAGFFVVYVYTKGIVLGGPRFKQSGLHLDFSLCVHLNLCIHSFGKDLTRFLLTSGVPTCIQFLTSKYFLLCCQHKMHSKGLKNTLSAIFSCPQ